VSKKRKGSTGNEAADLMARFREGFISGKMKIEEGEWIIEQLQSLADDAVPLAVEMLASPNEDTRHAAIVLLRELDDPRAVGPLKQMLYKPDYSDEEKLKILHVLDELGEPVDEDTFRRAISDPGALMRNSMNRMLEVIEDPVQVEAFLEAMGEGRPEMQEQYVRDRLGPLADRRLLLMLATLLYNEHDAVIVAAVDAIERLKEPATIPLLEERAQYDPSRRVRHAAENAALRLRTRVGALNEKHPPPSWITPSPLPLAYCMLSTIDGSGGQVLFIAREQPDTDLQLVDLMFNDHEGIKDCFSAFVDEEELNEMMDTFTDTGFVDISLERARAEVARAYQVTLDARRRLPATFIAWQGWLEGEDARSIEEFPLPPIEPSRQPELLAECAELLTLGEFNYWFFNPDEVKSFVPRYRKLLRKGQVERGQAHFETLLDKAIKSLIDEEYRRLLANRLRRQAWLLAQLYEDEEVPLWALAAAAALEECVIVEHPLLRDMTDRSFLNAVGRYR
jgi:HEAT repeat protein